MWRWRAVKQLCDHTAASVGDWINYTYVDYEADISVKDLSELLTIKHFNCLDFYINLIIYFFWLSDIIYNSRINYLGDISVIVRANVAAC